MMRGNEFFGELVGAVVVGAARDGNGHFEGVAIGAHHHVGARLRSTIGTVGLQRRFFGEVAGFAERAIDFVGRNLVIAHALAPFGVAVLVFAHDPRAAGGIEQVLRAQNVGLQEELRVFDGAVHMALGGEVHHDVDVVFLEKFVGQRAVADVAFHEEAALLVDVGGNGAKVAGVGERVEHHDAHIVVVLQQIFHVVCANEAGAARHEISFHSSVCLSLCFALAKII